MTRKRIETISIGHERIGKIIETSRGFELFDDRDRYLHTVTTIQDARRTLFERHRHQSEAARA